jgi:hypothetical protein
MAYYAPAASASTSANNAVRSVTALITHLTSAKCLTLRNKRLDADLAALAALVSPRLGRRASLSCNGSTYSVLDSPPFLVRPTSR